MWDGIIVGGGLAGLTAGIRAAERGKRILNISEGVGSLTYSSGVIDLGDVGRLLSRENHPYALLGETVVRAGLDYFQALFSDYQGKWGENQQVLTPLGSPRKAGLVPSGLNAEALLDARQIVLVAPEGMKDFFPEVIKANLERSYPQSIVAVYPIRIDEFEEWRVLGKSITGMDYAKFWRSALGMVVLKRVLDRLSQVMQYKGQNNVEGKGFSGNEDKDRYKYENESLQTTVRGKFVVVFPGLAAAFSEPLKDVLSEVPFPVVEMTAFPPSASGQALYNALKKKFKALGGELLVGAGVREAKVQGTMCQSVMVKSKGRDTAFSACSFVLASGGIFGGGIQVAPESVSETVFGLPLHVPSTWTQAEFLGEQPYAQMGIEVDRDLRPVDPCSGDVLLKNVRVIGRMLAHWDPWVEHCGGGVSLASGWFAGEQM